MSEVFTAEEIVELRRQFASKRNKQLKLYAAHEAAGNLGMAYLALWALLEFFAKHLGPASKRETLREALLDWLSYLNRAQTTKPSGLGERAFELTKKAHRTIPEIPALQRVLPLAAAPEFFEILDSNGKFRQARNETAHSGDHVSRQLYDEFTERGLRAVAEIDAWLEGVTGD